MAKLQKQPKPDYSLRRRFFNQIGEPMDWKDYGLGIWTDLETIQRQIVWCLPKGGFRITNVKLSIDVK